MQKYIGYFLAVVAGICFSTACNNDEIEYNKGEEALAFSVDNTNITLDAHFPNQDALTFQWTSGTNGGTNSAISYMLQIDRQGNGFNNGVSLDLGRRVYSHKYTHSQLNNLLLDEFGVTPGSSINLETRIIAFVANENASDQASEALTITARSYKPVSSTLYLIGDATPGGWSLDNATQLNPVSNSPGSFVISVDLRPGNFKFVTTRNDFLPSYNRDATAAEPKLIYRDGDNQPDEQFGIEKAGRYRIAVNLLDLTINIEEQTVVGPKYSKMYLVGDFTGWGFWEMRQDAFNPFIFRYGAVLNGGGDRDFKFGTASGSWDNMLHPTIPNAPITHTNAMFDDSGDYKWVLSTAQNNKPYKIAIDITEGAERMYMTEYTPYTTLYVIGDASPIGWSLNDREQTRMTKGADDFTYTWTGTLKTGEIKFKCADDSSWDNDENHPWYMAPEENLPVVPNTDMVLTPSFRAAGDRKWIVQEAGTYTITINQLTETIKFAK
ncbi:MAG: SusF/SusE family outer membrane protein [Dysgonamonadaceae bacterium]|jgi:hypothetical protein|nr:SusF/SusE family outer membrane protein [Dysgonamonadaceae bacterium]